MVVMQRYITYQDSLDRRRKEHAAIIIQAQIRKFLAIKLVERLRYEREMLRQLQEKHAAIVIQRFYRNHRQEKYERAAIVLQSHVRRFLATRYVKKMRARRSLNPSDQEKRRCEQERAATIIQSQIRKFLANRRVNRIRADLDALRQIRERHAAVVIQRFYRSHRLERHRRFEKAAIVLQSYIRRFLALRRYKRLKRSLAVVDQSVDPEKETKNNKALGWLHSQDKNQSEISDESLNAACDRLFSKTTMAAQAVYNAGLLESSSKNPDFDDYTAAVTIQKSWRGYNARRRHSDVLEKLAQTRLSFQNAPNIPENPCEHRNLSVGERINIYMPLFYTNSTSKRLLAAAFMNRITKNSPQFVKEFIDRNGIPAIIASSLNLGHDRTDTLLQKELADLLYTCLNCPESKKDVNACIRELLQLLVDNVNRYSENEMIMEASCNSIRKLCQHPDAPGNLKKLKFPFYVSQWRRQLEDNSKSELLYSLQMAEESLKEINALAE